MLIELTSAYERTRVALAHEVIGEVKDLRGTRSWSATTGNTLVIAKRNRRVHWRVEEPYDRVVAAVRTAELSQGSHEPGGTVAAANTRGRLDGQPGCLSCGRPTVGSASPAGAPAGQAEPAGPIPEKGT